MKVDVHFTRAEVDAAALGESTVVVIDVLRATTTIVEALRTGQSTSTLPAPPRTLRSSLRHWGERTRSCAASARV
mgnify:CR=1 FL=1